MKTVIKHILLFGVDLNPRNDFTSFLVRFVFLTIYFSMMLIQFNFDSIHVLVVHLDIFNKY